MTNTKWIDLRSDTVTAPTDEMREAMGRAEVGDDVYGDDPTTNRLEALAADMAGKEAALFVPSGTFGNQLALFTHCERGDEVLVGDDCHILAHEVGAAAVIAGVQARTFSVREGRVDPIEVKAKIREDDIHYPKTGLICLENALGDGRVIGAKNMAEVHAIARGAGLPVHVDGARVFNAAAALGVDARELTRHCDSIMFCLSKGLCAPVGSMLAGTRDFVAKARKKRKLMGGGLRQTGILAAAGIIALEKMTLRLKEDHDNAKRLAAGLAAIDGVKVLKDCLDINLVFFDMSATGMDGHALKRAFLDKGIKINPDEDGLMRFVTHYWVSERDVDTVVRAFKEVLAARK